MSSLSNCKVDFARSILRSPGSAHLPPMSLYDSLVVFLINLTISEGDWYAVRECMVVRVQPKNCSLRYVYAGQTHRKCSEVSGIYGQWGQNGIVLCWIELK